MYYVVVQLDGVLAAVVDCRFTYLKCTHSALLFPLNLRSLALLEFLLVLEPAHLRHWLAC